VEKNIESNVSFEACILTYLKRLETSETILKTMSLKHVFWQYLKRFGTAETKAEKYFSKACIVAVFKTICNCRVILKTRTLTFAF